MRSEVIAITRAHLGNAAGFIGGVALLLGLFGLIWQGNTFGFVGVALAVGGVGIILWLLLNPREVVSVVTGRQARYSTVAVISTFLLVGIVAMTYTFVQRNAITVDMTQTQSYTLTNASLSVLRAVNRPIQITGFYSSRALRLREVDDQFFRLYETATNGLIRRVYIDPDEQPAVAERFGAIQDGLVYLSFLNADGSIDFTTLMSVPRGSNQERDMTEAISRLLISGTIAVYFEVGHGERDPLDTSQEGMSGVHDGIQANGLITNPLSLPALVAEGEAVPADAAAVIMARPTSDLAPDEIALLDAYLKDGGALLIMTDPLSAQDSFLRQDGDFNRFLWNNYGIRALDALVVDPAASGQTALDVIGALVFTGSTISERLDPAESPVQFRLARALEVSRTPPANVPNGILIQSSPAAYGETNLQALTETNTYAYDEGQDVPAPLNTAVWAQNRQTNARIVLIGDSDFASNGYVQFGGNGILFTDALTWLTGYSERIGFGSQAYFYDLPLIAVDRQTLDRVAFVTVMLMPGAMLVAALVVWMRRVNR